MYLLVNGLSLWWANIESWSSFNYKEISKLDNQYISPTISQIYNKNEVNKNCEISISSGNIYIWWRCDTGTFEEQLTKQIKNNTKELLNIIWPYIAWRDGIYIDYSTWFEYSWWKPFFASGDNMDVANSLPDILSHAYILDIYFDSRVYIPISDIKEYISKNYLSRYIANRDISLYSDCQRQNFNVAMNKLQNTKIASGWIWNINTELTDLPWYCTWPEWSDKYLFYQWVCGTSTMFFRNALINPNIYITKRQAHSNRYIKYYWDYIYGDDAAIYEMQKQLELKNTSDDDIYIKFWTKWDLQIDDNKYLISITSAKNDKYTKIIKTQSKNDEKFNDIDRYIYNKDSLTCENSKALVHQSWKSNYYNKIYDTN